MPPDLADLLCADRSQLAAAMRGGHAIDPEALDDSCYRGISLGLPRWVEALSWKTFMKCFHRDPKSGRLRGWNVRLEQDGIAAPCRAQTRRDDSLRSFGHFEVVPPQDHGVPSELSAGLLIHYGLGRNHWLDPIGLLRDPVVALRPGDASLLLGWSYLDLGFDCPTPSYFTLERVGDLGEGQGEA
jgi:hypothetical protein